MSGGPGLTREELADRAAVDPGVVDRLVELGILSPGEGAEPFAPGDVHRVRLVLACEEAGMPAEAVGRAIAEGRLSLSFMDLPHYRWAARTDTTYGQLAERVGLPEDLVLEVSAALGSPRRSPEDPVREDDATVFELIRTAAAFLDRGALVRTSRVYAEAIRRIVDAETALWDSHVLGALLRQGLSFREAVDLANSFGAEATPLQERMIITVYRRLQEQRWTEYTVEGIERVLEEMGLYERSPRPPAFAFVDLTGYTRLTEERGDAAGAGIAAELVEMVDAVATEAGGEIVKWLGDGVMVRFRDPGEAVGAVLEVVARAPRIGLAAHAGIAAGAAVLQDGDYFGRTVNLAARVASVAAPGQTLLTDEVVEAASGRGFRFRPMGTVELKGFGEPVRLFEAWPERRPDRPRPR